jgi:uncharacterized repeat protein (TIGR03803 family)
VLYGTTSAGGASNWGTVFRVGVDGTGHVILKSFGGPDGATPFARLARSGSVLYGTTCYGGASGRGTVFRLNTDGSGFEVVKHFSGPDGSYPGAGLSITNGIAYGTTRRGGDLDSGTVFQIALPMASVVVPPKSQIAVTGGSVTFECVVTGPGPITFQWRKNGVAIPGANSASLTLTNIGAGDDGSYDVALANPYGQVTSPAATLTVSVARIHDPKHAADGSFQFRVEVQTGSHGEIQITTNLAIWFPLFHFTNAPRWLDCHDPDTNNQSTRFYRALIR